MANLLTRITDALSPKPEYRRHLEEKRALYAMYGAGEQLSHVEDPRIAQGRTQKTQGVLSAAHTLNT